MVAKCLLCKHAYCDKFSQLTNKKVSFHSLPKNGPVRAEWIEVIQSVLGKTWAPIEERRFYVCSDHFKNESFKTYGAFPRLIDGSVPTENISLFDKKNASDCPVSKSTVQDARSTPFPKEEQVLCDEIDIMQANSASIGVCADQNPEIVKIGGCPSGSESQLKPQKQEPKQKLYSDLFNDFSRKIEQPEMQSQPFTEEDYKEWKKLRTQVHRLYPKLAKEAEYAENLRRENIQLKKLLAKSTKEWRKNQEKGSAKIKKLEASNLLLKRKKRLLLKAAKEKVRRRDRRLQLLQDAKNSRKEQIY